MQDSSEVALRSPIDGTALTFRVLARKGEAVDFETSVRKPWCEARALASSYVVGSPAVLFAEMAQEWRGWSGKKTWQDLEGRVSLAAESDSVGHVLLTVDLVGHDFEDRLRVVFQYEAGQLEDLAVAVRNLLG
jgi:hypothetical protein